jgi:hypothetical protein
MGAPLCAARTCTGHHRLASHAQAVAGQTFAMPHMLLRAAAALRSFLGASPLALAKATVWMAAVGLKPVYVMAAVGRDFYSQYRCERTQAKGGCATAALRAAQSSGVAWLSHTRVWTPQAHNFTPRALRTWIIGFTKVVFAVHPPGEGLRLLQPAEGATQARHGAGPPSHCSCRACAACASVGASRCEAPHPLAQPGVVQPCALQAPGTLRVLWELAVALRLPYMLVTGLGWRDLIFNVPIQVGGGWAAQLPSGPGRH